MHVDAIDRDLCIAAASDVRVVSEILLRDDSEQLIADWLMRYCPDRFYVKHRNERNAFPRARNL